MSLPSRKTRRTLEDISYYPTPQELHKDLMQSPGWPYKTNQESYQRRDRALFSILYLAELRISEALRLVKKQFVPKETYLYVQAILLSKRKPGKVKYRDARLPLKGERAVFTQLIQDYIITLEDEDRLFPWSLDKSPDTNRIVGTSRAWQIINALAEGKLTQHWLRAFGYNYLYDEWEHDILAVADSSKTDPRTLAHYIRRRHERYKVV